MTSSDLHLDPHVCTHIAAHTCMPTDTNLHTWMHNSLWDVMSRWEKRSDRSCGFCGPAPKQLQGSRSWQHVNPFFGPAFTFCTSSLQLSMHIPGVKVTGHQIPNTWTNASLYVRGRQQGFAIDKPVKKHIWVAHYNMLTGYGLIWESQ